MRRINKILVISYILFLYNGNIFAQDQKRASSIDQSSKWLIGIKLSTFGAGIESQFLINNRIHLRSIISYTNLTYSIEHFRDDLKGDIHFSPSGLMLGIDYKAYNNFYFSLGTFLNFTKITLAGKLKDPVLVGDIEMTPNEVGQISAKIVPMNLISPYMGVRFEHSINPSKDIMLAYDLAILYHGKPKVDLSADGMLTPTATKEQELLIEENISPLTVYPIISISLLFQL